MASTYSVLSLFAPLHAGTDRADVNRRIIENRLDDSAGSSQARMPRERADIVLVQRGLFESRAKAQEAIAAGLVKVEGQPLRKASELVAPQARIEAAPAYPYVSRGGVKLEHGLKTFGFDPDGKICLDIGASTGGFTDVLLRHGAAKVFCVDVGHGQLHERIAVRPEVVALEGTDARALEPSMFAAPPQLIVCDVSFISLKLVLPHVLSLAAAEAALVALIKPQFEAGPGDLKKGILRDEALREKICRDIAQFVESLGWRVVGLVASPIDGGDGNREFLIGAQARR
jgi:23S rRNA (cytidine1920-2'-O)/16S rRNA (cytidine1409-2'-O)-methyltransferase